MAARHERATMNVIADRKKMRRVCCSRWCSAAGRFPEWVSISDCPMAACLPMSEHGPSDGSPLFYFHGSPGSRLAWKLFAEPGLAEELGIRLIVPDRPSLGHSDFQPRRTLGDWPTDITPLADHLGLTQFAVLGYSGGGPYALACALKIPERLTPVGIVSGTAPIQGD
jgi:pimeloyl-ACP methyl ester carboxylesterase